MHTVSARCVSAFPAAFEGFRIVQLSDFHAGTFLQTERVKRSIAAIAELKPDLFVFTGDAVNTESDELPPYVDALKALKGTQGSLSILGNHDYGDYKEWPSPQAKANNMAYLQQLHRDIGWKLLRNEHIILEKEGAQLAIAGSENWSKRSERSRYGNLEATLSGIPEGVPVILLTHDPTHWDAEVLSHSRQVALTLSGHTHGMQFGVEVPGIHFSPAQWLYSRWAGHYVEGSRQLYVNRGFGMVGFPGRLGIPPEVTEITLTAEG